MYFFFDLYRSTTFNVYKICKRKIKNTELVTIRMANTLKCLYLLHLCTKIHVAVILPLCPIPWPRANKRTGENQSSFSGTPHYNSVKFDSANNTEGPVPFGIDTCSKHKHLNCNHHRHYQY